jgi:hypothetical protein
MTYYYKDGKYEYEFYFVPNLINYLDIITRIDGEPGRKAWAHKIVNGKVVWRQDDFLELTDGAKTYINRIVGLKAFL